MTNPSHSTDRATLSGHEMSLADTALRALRPLTGEQRGRVLAMVRVYCGIDQKPRRPRVRPPDGLRTKDEAAAKLGISVKTLNGYVETGALKYVALGHGKRRKRKMFTDADLNEFIANQTRKDDPCPSTASRARRTGTSISGGEVIAFTGVPRPQPGGKRRR